MKKNLVRVALGALVVTALALGLSAVWAAAVQGGGGSATGDTPKARSAAAADDVLKLAGFTITMGNDILAVAKRLDWGGLSYEVASEGSRTPLGLAPPEEVRRRPSKLVMRPFTMYLPAGGIRPAMGEWISSFLTGNNMFRQEGAITLLGPDATPCAQTSFRNACLTEVAFPVLDAESEQQFLMQASFVPETIQAVKPPKPLPSASPSSGGGRRGLVYVCNFRFELSGIDTPHVRRISPITVTRTVTPSPDRSRPPTVGPASISNITVTFAGVKATEAWTAWYEDFVVRGNSGGANVKTGAIVLLDNETGGERARLTLRNVGILRLAPGTIGGQGGVETLHMVAELYAEKMDFALAK